VWPGARWQPRYDPELVKVGQPSLTARGVALARSRLVRPHAPEGDPEAEQRLYLGLQPPLLAAAMGSDHRRGTERRARRLANIAARTAFLDDETLRAVTGGADQVVIVGAGYDGRGLRFRQRGVRFFEVDHPGTQADKRRRLGALGIPLDHITFVECDLTAERVEAALARAGQRDDRPSLFICEGLVRYLDRVAVNRMLSGLRSRAARGSRLLVTVSETPGGDRRAARRLYLAAIGEPVRSSFAVGEISRVLAGAGWAIDREVRRSEPGGRHRLLVAAIPTA